MTPNNIIPDKSPGNVLTASDFNLVKNLTPPMTTPLTQHAPILRGSGGSAGAAAFTPNVHSLQIGPMVDYFGAVVINDKGAWSGTVIAEVLIAAEGMGFGLAEHQAGGTVASIRCQLNGGHLQFLKTNGSYLLWSEVANGHVLRWQVRYLAQQGES